MSALLGAALVAATVSACGSSASGLSVSEVVAVDGGVLVTSTESGHTAWLIDDDGRNRGRAGESAGQPRQTSCLETVCYRVGAGQLAVQRSDDGGHTYHTVWSVSGAVYDDLVSRHGGQHPTSRSVALRPTSHGVAVFVANDVDGLLYGDSSGGWHRLGVPRGGEGWYFDSPPRLSTDPQPPGLRLISAATVAGIVVLAGLAAMLRQHQISIWRAARVLSPDPRMKIAAALASH